MTRLTAKKDITIMLVSYNHCRTSVTEHAPSGVPGCSLSGVLAGTCISLLTFFSPFSSSLAQPVMQQVYRESVRSVQFHREGWELSYPVLELGGTDRLVLNFDELGGQVAGYTYRIIHCDAFWNPSNIPEGDYLDGFYENQIKEYALSFNTFCNYVNYRVTIPNEDLSIKLSGNYVLMVCEDFDETRMVLTRRFVVAENLVSVHAVEGRPILSMFRDNGQEVDVTVRYRNFPLNDPYSEVNLTICQNNRWDVAIYDLKPVFMGDGELSYDYQKENVFPGGNEYRYFDIKSLRYQPPEISRIEYIAPYYHVYLRSDRIRSGHNYFYQQDLNGRYYVDIQEGTRKDVEADYVYVHFTLEYEVPLTEGDVYVFGALSDWSAGEGNMMSYSFDRKAYEATLLLKQGYYNYEYVYVNSATGYRDPHFMEGSFYETENSYVIYLYYTDQAKRYDRVVGYQIISSAE